MRPKSNVRWVLAGSLALNVFLATVIGVHRWGRPPGSPPDPARVAEEIAATLPPADADILRAAFAKHRARLEAAHKAMRGMPRRVHDALTADTFDEARLRGAFDAGSRARQQMDDAIADVVAAAAKRMSTEGRHKMAEWRPSHPPP